MNDGLIDLFRHNAWATRQLLDVCQALTDEQLATTVPGTYGSIIDTLRHTVRSEGGYCRRLTGDEPDWYASDDTPTVTELMERCDDLESRWAQFLTTSFDAERTFIMPWHDGIYRDVPADIVLAQVIHHGNEHRSQVATALTTLGVEPPGWGLWEYAAATNRAPQRQP